MKAAKSPQLDRKDRLFEDFFDRMVHVTDRLEVLFSVSGIANSVFDGNELHSSFALDADSEGISTIKFDGNERNSHRSVLAAALRRHRTWKLLSDLIDYALDGIAPTLNATVYSNVVGQMLDESQGLLKVLESQHYGPLTNWGVILETAMARNALDEGHRLTPDAVALLGGVDLRTVRNAISSGAMTATEDALIESLTARAWLIGRKGYKPTIRTDTQGLVLNTVETPSDFATLLKQQRIYRERELSSPNAEVSLLELLPANPGLTPELLAEVEAGVFRAPLGVVSSLADIYGLPREKLLACVMRVFFPSEFFLLQRAEWPANSTSKSGG